jgi:catechol 2,3-dioxygenase-like lactoylglutathione lyase family enzyme
VATGDEILRFAQDDEEARAMITFLDHVAVAGSADAYETLLGRRAANGRLQTGNVGLAFGAAGDAFSSMVFATSDLDKAARLLERRAVPSERAGDRLVLSREATHGVPIELCEHQERAAPSPLAGSDEAASISALDHVVVRTPNPDRAIAFYAGRLGLDLRLDRSNPAWGARLLFFRCGDLVVEIAHDLNSGVSDGPDQLWGLSWRTPDIAKANARLKAAGIDVSEPRDGRRPGSQVFTVKSHTEGVPTIVIGGIGRWPAR